MTGNPLATCNLLVSIDVSMPMGLASATMFRDRIQFQVPNDSGILGAVVYAQWYTRFESRLGSLPPAFNFGTTDALRLVVGR